jgi:hypothetical protein
MPTLAFILMFMFILVFMLIPRDLFGGAGFGILILVS